jgi:endonuclease-3
MVERLEGVHGRAEHPGTSPALDMLIACILSQHTSDANSHRAYARLRERFASWADVAEADVGAVEEVVRCGGLGPTKARTIVRSLGAIRAAFGDLSLEPLRHMGNDEARAVLLRLPGVGPKTAAIVLCFAMGRPVLPVDTHVFRVAWRTGLVDRRMGEARAHEALGAVVPSDLVYRFHVCLIRHGRATCRARVPDCGACAIADMCAYCPT